VLIARCVLHPSILHHSQAAASNDPAAHSLQPQGLMIGLVLLLSTSHRASAGTPEVSFFSEVP
jgi:hypothetical protein